MSIFNKNIKIETINYLLILCFAFANILLISLTHISINILSIIPSIIIFLVLGIAYFTIHQLYKNRQILREDYLFSKHAKILLISLSQIILLTNLGAIFSYLIIPYGAAPLYDSIFDKCDKFLGFDWLSWFKLISQSPIVFFILKCSYNSIFPQTIILLVILSFLGKIKELEEFIFLFSSTLFITIILSACFPALAAFEYYQISPELFGSVIPSAPYTHIETVQKLRSGNFIEIDLDNLKGLITFPSFHASLAVIFMIAAKDIRILKWFFFICNILMLISTPFHGGHYLVDTLAGVLIVAILILIKNKLPTNKYQ